MARSVAISFAVLLAVFEIASSQKCYQCNSEAQPQCKDPFPGQVPANLIVDCMTQDSVNFNRNYLSRLLPPQFLNSLAGSPRGCGKVVLESGTVVRTCFDINPLKADDTCVAMKKAVNYEVNHPTSRIKSCEICMNTLCNGAGSITTSMPLALLAAVVSYLFYKQ